MKTLAGRLCPGGSSHGATSHVPHKPGKVPQTRARSCQAQKPASSHWELKPSGPEQKGPASSGVWRPLTARGAGVGDTRPVAGTSSSQCSQMVISPCWAQSQLRTCHLAQLNSRSFAGPHGLCFPTEHLSAGALGTCFPVQGPGPTH